MWIFLSEAESKQKYGESEKLLKVTGRKTPTMQMVG